jgi:nitroimidazol reductase NimA-like FMN-containing flavoprotein (pyridoxamine 5'-phosphate oxidase superfamily)
MIDRRAVTEEPGWTRLGQSECLELLARTDQGRVAISIGALPAIVSVRYTVEDDQIVFAVSDGDVWRATDDHIIAFQADGVDACHHCWSVCLVGRARHGPVDGRPLVVLSTERIAGQRERQRARDRGSRASSDQAGTGGDDSA